MTHEQRQRGKGWAVPSKQAHALKVMATSVPILPDHTPPTTHTHTTPPFPYTQPHLTIPCTTHPPFLHFSLPLFATFHFNKTAVITLFTSIQLQLVVFFLRLKFIRKKRPVRYSVLCDIAKYEFCPTFCLMMFPPTPTKKPNK